nr:(2Fe-2S)-binding protein [Alteribacter salitolerans]
MLKPASLGTLDAGSPHFFCPAKDCPVVYFDKNKKTYRKTDVKVSVYHKDASSDTPVCYCFNWTKEKLKNAIQTEEVNPIEQIRENIKKDRCGCEVNNPQGSCCLGNVTGFIKQGSA